MRSQITLDLISPYKCFDLYSGLYRWSMEGFEKRDDMIQLQFLSDHLASIEYRLSVRNLE